MLPDIKKLKKTFWINAAESEGLSTFPPAFSDFKKLFRTGEETASNDRSFLCLSNFDQFFSFSACGDRTAESTAGTRAATRPFTTPPSTATGTGRRYYAVKKA